MAASFMANWSMRYLDDVLLKFVRGAKVPTIDRMAPRTSATSRRRSSFRAHTIIPNRLDNVAFPRGKPANRTRLDTLKLGTVAQIGVGHALRDTAMDIKGVLEIRVGSETVNAAAQHISNASALRASLMGFFLAFWEYVLKEHGGLALILLDDPQELLDHDNKDKLARLLPELVGEGAQLIVATYDRHFSREVAHVGRAQKVAVEHLSVHPVNTSRAVLHVAHAMEDLDRKREAYEKDKDNSVLAQDYAGQVRVFVEARLGDIFDDPAYPSYSTGTKKPTLGDHLGRLRGLVKTVSNALFKSKAVTDFCACRHWHKVRPA
jgi:hypothetical protein